MTLPVWLGSNALVSINVVTLWQVKSVPGWVTGKPPQRRTRDPAHRLRLLYFTSVLYIDRRACLLSQIHMKTMQTSVFRLLTGQDTPHYIWRWPRRVLWNTGISFICDRHSLQQTIVYSFDRRCSAALWSTFSLCAPLVCIYFWYWNLCLLLHWIWNICRRTISPLSYQ